MPEMELTAQCCIAGGGPAGMVLGYLLARAGVSVVVLEKHADFLRDFRGDTIHPSTLELMHELGLLDSFLALPHSRLTRLTATFGKEKITLADFSRLATRCRFIAMMPQWHFLDFIAREAARLPGFKLVMRAEAQDLLRQGEAVAGVRAATPDGALAVRAPLTVAADGRHSTLRARAGLEVRDIGAPIDVLWFRIARGPNAGADDFGHFDAGRILVTLDRGDYWQCAFVIPKGAVETIKAKGLDSFRAGVAATAPALRAHIDDVRSWDDVKLLSVAIDRLEHWSLPGLLCIGDAAHAMSPVGGVGINLAIQDAVATANRLAAALREGRLAPADLVAVQRRREWPARVIQALQVRIQNGILRPVLGGQHAALRPPWFLRLVSRNAWLRGRASRVLGVGVRPEHVRSPALP